METVRKIKKKSFEEKELMVIAMAMGEESEVVNAPLDNKVTNKKKREAWERITLKTNALGVDQRSWIDIRKKWYDLTRQVGKAETERRKHARGTGGGSPLPPPGPLETQILSFIPETKIVGVPGGVDTSQKRKQELCVVESDDGDHQDQGNQSDKDELEEDHDDPTITPGTQLLMGPSGCTTPQTLTSAKKRKVVATRREESLTRPHEEVYIQTQVDICAELKKNNEILASMRDVQLKSLGIETRRLAVLERQLQLKEIEHTIMLKEKDYEIVIPEASK